MNHIAKHAWHFRFRPQSWRLLIISHSLKGRELFNNPSVFQAANRLSTINGKAARSQTYLGTDERFRLFTFNVTLVPTQDLWAHYWKFLKHTVTGTKRFLKTYKAHIQQESPPENPVKAIGLEHYSMPVLFTKTKASSKTQRFSWKW